MIPRLVGVALLAGGVWSTLGAGPAGAQAGRDVEGVAPAVVGDADGRPVGALEGFDISFFSVGLRVAGRLVALQVTREHIHASGRVAFESTNCQGPALLIPARPPGSGGFHSEAGVGPGRILRGAAGAPESRLIASVYVPGDIPACQPVTVEARDVYATVELMDLDTFSPPFALR